MKESLLRQAAKLKQKNHDHKRWQKAVSILACVVVFCTVYALILPAVTMEKTAYCGKEEHTHTEECYEKQLICGKEEGEGSHQHSDDCYREEQVLICTTPESDGHQHTDACYTEEKVLTCTNTDPDHVHNEFEGCYTVEKKLTCGQEEGEGAHHHTAECYETQKVLVCGQEENDGHHHTEDCYKKELICQKEEHTHTLECYSNPEADVETEAQWSRTFANVTLTGDWAKDLTAIAETQTGYTESDRNYTVNADNTTNGYTRYGQWAGMPYADWSATFTSFCLYYANVPESAVPRNTGCEGWNSSAVSPNGYTPKEGDLILLDGNQDGTADHAGIVTSGSTDSVTAIVGDSDKAVRRNTYSTSNAIITGYVPMPKNPDFSDGKEEPISTQTPTPEVTDEPEVDPTETPGVTEKPEVTPTEIPKITETPEVTPTPLLTEKPEQEVTPTPVVTGTPAPTPTPKAILQPSENPESDELSWCIVEQDSSIQEDANGELGDTDIFSEEINEIATYSDVFFRVNSAMSVKLDDYVTGATVAKLENGQWKKLEGDDWILTDGDKILVDINYVVNGGLPAGKNSLTYQLPANITLDEEMSGPVTQKGVTVGSYTISKYGEVIITLDPSKFNPNESFTGKFQFEGTANKLSDGDSEKIVFPGIDKEITIKKDKSEYDLSISKDAKLSDDRKTIDYTVTVSSKEGTGTDAITQIEDYFNSSDAKGSYIKDSFTIVKVDAQGKETSVDIQPAFKDNDNKFVYENLAPLGKNEKYIIKYKADVKEDSIKGGGKVSNSANVKTPGKSNSTTKDTTIPGVMIEKSGYYDSDTDQIKWTVILNKDSVADMSGYVFTDTLPEGVTLSSLENISIEPTCNITKTYENNTIKVEFPQNAGKQKYELTFITSAPDTSAGNTNNVHNTANLTGNGGTWSAGTDVTVKPREEGITKSFTSESMDMTGKNITYKWNTDLTLPTTPIDEIIYEDTIESAVDDQGNHVVGQNHYGIASDLKSALQTEMKLKLGTGEELNYSQITEQGYNVSFEFFDENGGTVSETDANTPVKSFKVKISNLNIVCISLQMKYSTHVNYDGMTEGDKWTFKNKGTYNGHSSEASHSYKKPAKLVKQIGVKDSNGNITYQDGDKALDYNETDGYLYYRLIVHTSSDDNDDIEITDTLSDADMSFDVNSVRGQFYWTEEAPTTDKCYNFANHTFNNNRNETYDLTQGESRPVVSVKTDETTHKQTLHITIKGGYNKFLSKYEDKMVVCENTPHSFAISYRVKISDDPVWNDANAVKKTYGNSAMWNGVKSETITLVNKDEQEEVKKSGTQRIEVGTDGKTTYYDMVDYSVVINPIGKDLIPDKDTVELVDSLNCPDGVKAYLELESLKLYTYDNNTKDHLGTLLDRSKYNLKYDDSNLKNPKLTVTVPDELACVLVYTYRFDRGSVASKEITVGNTANLEGGYSSGNTVEVCKNSASAVVEQGNVTIYKVDADDYSVRLSGTEFTLKSYDSSGNWVDADIEINKSCNATKKTDAADTIYTTGTDGYLRLDMDTAMDGNINPKLLQPDTVYKLTERKASDGYELNSEPYYFVILKDKKEESFKWSAPLNNQKKVYYFENGKSVNMTVTNKFTGISVRKVWEDKDGNVITDTSNQPEITVKLYRHTGQKNGCKVTFAYGGKKTDTYYLKRNTTALLKIKHGYNNAPEALNEVFRKHGYNYIQAEKSWIREVEITGDQDYTLEITDWSNSIDPKLNQYYFGVDSISIEGTRDNTYTLSEEQEVEEQTLNKSNNWTYVWNDLESSYIDEETKTTKPYYYTVKESSTLNGYNVSYTNNNGVQTGSDEIVIINKRTEEHNDYVLPETGGTGINRFTAVGLSLMAASLMCEYVMRRKRRERRGN